MKKIDQLLTISGDKFVFPEYYSHDDRMMWKIENIWTNYAKDMLVLCEFERDFDEVLTLAIETITKQKKLFFGEE